MTKQEIEAFLTAAHYGSITVAAGQLYITQPALSRRIQNLERELGYQLFTRGQGFRGISLTEQGRAFLPVARQWNEVYREAIALQSLDSRPSFRVSSIGSVSRFLLPRVLRELTADPETCRLSFHLCHSEEAYSLIENGFSDLVLVDNFSGPNSNRVLSLPIYSVPLVVVGGAAWQGATTVPSASLDPNKEISLPWHTAFDLWHSERFGTGCRFFAQLDDSSMVKALLRDDVFAVMPKTEALAAVSARDDIVMFELEDGPPDEIIHCLYPASAADEHMIKLFLRLAERACRSSDGIRCLL